MNPPTHFRNLLALAFIGLLLSGCQHLGLEPDIQIVQTLSEQRPIGCPEDDESCPLVNIDIEQFVNEPILNTLIDERLRRMTLAAPGSELPLTLEDYQERFLREAEPHWSSYLQAKLRARHGDILVVELSSYLFTGGAHGMPGRGFINFDRRQQRQLLLQDVLLPGQEGNFWRLARQAHQRWLVANELESDADFVTFWPFRQTSHFALLKDSVLLKYDVYSIAPYASGHPELSIPHEQLEGILRPEYLD